MSLKNWLNTVEENGQMSGQQKSALEVSSPFHIDDLQTRFTL